MESIRDEIKKHSDNLDKLSNDFFTMITKEIEKKMKYGNKEKYEGGANDSTLRRRHPVPKEETDEERMKREQYKRQQKEERELLIQRAELFGYDPEKSIQELKHTDQQRQQQLQQQLQIPREEHTQQPMQSEEMKNIMEAVRSLQEGMQQSLESTSRIETTQTRMEMTLNTVDANIKRGFSDMRKNFEKLGGLIAGSKCHILIPSTYGHCLLLILSIMFMILKLGYRLYANINNFLFVLSNMPKTIIPFFYIGDLISLMLKSVIVMLNIAFLSGIAKSFGIWKPILTFISDRVASVLVVTFNFIKDTFVDFTSKVAQPTLDILDALVSPNTSAEERKGAFFNMFWNLFNNTIGFLGCLLLCFYNSKARWGMSLNEGNCNCSGATTGGTRSNHTSSKLTKNQLVLVNSSLRSQNLTNKQVESIKSILLIGGQKFTNQEIVGLKNAAQNSFVLMENFSKIIQTLINAVERATPQKAITYIQEGGKGKTRSKRKSKRK